jgi:hypothetical protein
MKDPARYGRRSRPEPTAFEGGALDPRRGRLIAVAPPQVEYAAETPHTSAQPEGHRNL